jgi:hypothetical protein
MSMKNMTIGQIQELVENPGQPIRQPATAVLTIDTADRQAPATTLVNNIYINKQQTLMEGFFTRIALTEINYTWNIPNVNDRNNTISVNVQVPGEGEFLPVKATIETGFYTPDELATAVEAALEAAADAAYPAGAPYTFQVDYDDTTRTFSIDNNNLPFELSFGGTREGANLLWMMGFPGTTFESDSGQITKYTGTFAPMIYTTYFDIVSQQLTKKQNVRDNSTSVNTGNNLLARIYLTPDGLVKATPTDQADIVGCRPFTVYREFQNPKQIYWDTKEFINVVDLSLRDRWGNLLFESSSTETEIAPGDFEINVGSGYTNFQLTLQITET